MICDAELGMIPAVGVGAAAIQSGADPVAAGDEVGHVVFGDLLAHLPGQEVAELPPPFRPLPVEMPQVGSEHLQGQLVMVDGRAQGRPPHPMGQGEDLADIVKERGHHPQLAAFPGKLLVLGHQEEAAADSTKASGEYANRKQTPQRSCITLKVLTEPQPRSSPRRMPKGSPGYLLALRLLHHQFSHL